MSKWLREPRDEASTADTHLDDIVAKLAKAGAIQPVTCKSSTTTVTALAPKPGRAYDYLKSLMQGITKMKGTENVPPAAPKAPEGPKLNAKERAEANMAQIAQKTMRGLPELLHGHAEMQEDPKDQKMAHQLAAGDLGQYLHDYVRSKGLKGDQSDRIADIGKHLWVLLGDYDPQVNGPLHSWFPTAVEEADKQAFRDEHEGAMFGEKQISQLGTGDSDDDPFDRITDDRRIRRNPQDEAKPTRRLTGQGDDEPFDPSVGMNETMKRHPLSGGIEEEAGHEGSFRHGSVEGIRHGGISVSRITPAMTSDEVGNLVAEAGPAQLAVFTLVK